METKGYTIFTTPIGVCGIAWRQPDDTDSVNCMVTDFQLPEAGTHITESRLARRSTAELADPPTAITALIDRVVRHLSGESQDFADVAVDLSRCEPFSREVYVAARAVPAGQTRSYGALARLLDQPGVAQAVGQALGNNPIPLIVPCHRIVAADGKGGGFSTHGGLATKARLLVIEGAMTGDLGL